MKITRTRSSSTISKVNALGQLALTDTHCHLDAAEFAADRDAVVARARAAGVADIWVPAITHATFADTLAMREAYGCRIALGLHPIYIDEHRDEHLADLRQRIATDRPFAIGEIGLDFFVAGLDAERQTYVFAEQLRIARDADLPVLLHIRRAQDQVLKQLRRFGIRRGIAHAFNGSPQQADAYIGHGIKLGFGGTLTHPRALNIRRLAAELPLDAIVLETDAPDMSPIWAYGERNEPSYLVRIAEELAALRGLSVEEVALRTNDNARVILDSAT